MSCTKVGETINKTYVAVILDYKKELKIGLLEFFGSSVQLAFLESQLSNKFRTPVRGMWCLVAADLNNKIISIDVDYNNISNPVNGETARGINPGNN